MYLKNEKPLHQVEKLIPDTPSDNKQEIVEATPVNAEITSVNINDDKTVIKNECHETVNEAAAIFFLFLGVASTISCLLSEGVSGINFST
jgi:hypothetical protein